MIVLNNLQGGILMKYHDARTLRDILMTVGFVVIIAGYLYTPLTFVGFVVMLSCIGAKHNAPMDSINTPKTKLVANFNLNDCPISLFRFIATFLQKRFIYHIFSLKLLCSFPKNQRIFTMVTPVSPSPYFPRRYSATFLCVRK